ncbi:MAG: GTPase HflX [bacterium]
MERAIIVDTGEEEISFLELASLVETAGGKVVGELVQKKHQEKSPRFLLTKGKLKELKGLCDENKANLVVFNQDPSPSQIRNLEEELDLKVIDRTGIILDIFAQRARTAEAKIQTELALSYYLLPRLTGRRDLSRLGGGIGTRGPGEQKLEYDRRRIRKRISHLKKKLEGIKKEREQQRKKRKRDFLTCSIVGYTNAGKSTLLSALSKENVPSFNQLFTTLDPLSRRVRIGLNDIVFTDTVGFIQNLPLSLVSAFRATLEEICLSDIILHIVDVSHPYFRNQMASVEKILEELDVARYPRITAFNKIDLLSSKTIISHLKREIPNSTEISALKGEGFKALFDLFLKMPF